MGAGMTIERVSISEFTFEAAIPPLGVAADELILNRVARDLYATFLDVLEEARFFREDSLELRINSRGFEILFQDADLEFSFSLSDGRLSLRRRGSGLSRFKEWYSRIMPSLNGIVDKVSSSLVEHAEWPTARVLQAQMAFRVIAYDFIPVGSENRTSVKNARIMDRLVRSVPGFDGKLESPTAEDSDLGRVDYKLSRWVLQPALPPVREIFHVEAPSNRSYSALWLTYVVSGETRFESDGNRSMFDFSVFTEDNGMWVYEDLFINHFIKGFVGDLTQGYTFETTVGQLP